MLYELSRDIIICILFLGLARFAIHLLLFVFAGANLAMHLGAIAQCPSSPDYKCYALRFGFWGTLGISSGRRATVFGLPSVIERHRTNARLIAWQKKQYSFLWVVTDLCSGGFSSGFSCCFHGKYHYDSTFIYCWKLSELPNCVFLWFEKHFASHSSHCRSSLERKEVACYVKATITIDHYEAFGLTKSPLFGAACIDQASSYLEGAEQAPLRAFTKQWSPAMGNIIDPKPLTSRILP